MKILLKLLLMLTLSAALPAAESDILEFPVVGKTYEVIFSAYQSPTRSVSSTRIRVLKIASNGWLYVEKAHGTVGTRGDGANALIWISAGSLWLNPNALESAKEIHEESEFVYIKEKELKK